MKLCVWHGDHSPWSGPGLGFFLNGMGVSRLSRSVKWCRWVTGTALVTEWSGALVGLGVVVVLNMLWLWCWCWWLRFRVTLCAPSVQNSKAVAKEEASTQWVMTALHMLKRMDLEDVLAVDSTGILRRIPTYRYCRPHCSHIIASIEHASMFAKFI